MELDAATIERIYQGGLADPPWQDVVDLFCAKLDAVSLVLAFRVYADGLPSVGVQAFRGAGRLIWDAFFADFSSLSTFDYSQLQAGRIHALEEFTHAEGSGVARLRRELLAPLSAGEAYCTPLVCDGRQAAYLIWLKSAGKPIKPLEREWCQAAARPLSRAVGGFNRMRLAELSGQLTADALGRLGVGVVGLDRHDRIMFVNDVGERIIRESPDLSKHDGRLVIRPDFAAKFAAGRREPCAMRVRGSQDVTIGVLVSPVTGGRDELGPGSRPERAVYLHEATRSTPITERLVAELFGLSSMEARLCVLLCEGFSLREAGEQLGVTENTIRSYSKLVFSKIGVSGQVELVRVLLSSVAMFGNSRRA